MKSFAVNKEAINFIHATILVENIKVFIVHVTSILKKNRRWINKKETISL